MKLMEKILKKFDKKFDNYHEIINFGFPVLFCVEQNKDVKIGFVNEFKPTRGRISFILTKSNYNKIEDYIEENSSIRELFNKEILSYIYDKGKTKIISVDESGFDNYLPSEELSVQETFNDIDVLELIKNLRTIKTKEQIYLKISSNQPSQRLNQLVQEEVTFPLERLEDIINLYLKHELINYKERPHSALDFSSDMKEFKFEESLEQKSSINTHEYNCTFNKPHLIPKNYYKLAA
ncbi:TPA: hypothetical protein TZY76_000159 [Streptococcus suis]|nr:hypothetical protein [Streptococcus suis]